MLKKANQPETTERKKGGGVCVCGVGGGVWKEEIEKRLKTDKNYQSKHW